MLYLKCNITMQSETSVKLMSKNVCMNKLNLKKKLRSWRHLLKNNICFNYLNVNIILNNLNILTNFFTKKNRLRKKCKATIIPFTILDICRIILF